MVAHRIFHKALGFIGGEPVFGLPDKLRLADKTADQGAAARGKILAGDVFGFAVVHQFAVGADAFQNGGPETAFMGAAFRGGDRITVGLDEPVPRRGPIDRPFHFARGLKPLLKINHAAKGLLRIGGHSVQGFI